MEPLCLCWMMDKRWFCKIANCLNNYLFMLPIIADMLTITGILIQRDKARLDTSGWAIVLFALYGVIIAVNLALMVKVAVNISTQLEGLRENQQQIRQFTSQYETKRNVWSWWGLALLVLSIAQMVLNSQYIGRNIGVYPCLANQIRFWLDAACWGYIGLIVIVFLVCKLCFLYFSWRNPEFYLRHKGVI